MSEVMMNTRELILKLKSVKQEKELSLDKIIEIMSANHQFVSKTTLSRVFAKGSEDKSFRYEETLRPIANALLDMETIEENDDLDTQAYKIVIRLKKDLLEDYTKQIQELKDELKEKERDIEMKLDKEKLRYHEKLDKERAQFARSLDFLKNQIELKDKRIDQLMTSNDELTKRLLSCPYHGTCKE